MANGTNIDFVIPTRHDTSFVLRLLEQAAENPWWVCHTFHFVYDANAQESIHKLRTWLSDNREKPLPNIETYFAPPQATGRPNLLRQIGLNQGENPFVYFQDDDDPLPQNLDKCLEVMADNPDCAAVFGLTETYTPRGQRIERFPTMDLDVYGPQNIIDGMRIFPTYGHALSGVFRREIFTDTPLDDGQNYQMCGINAFILQLLENHPDVRAIPHVVRKVRQNPENPRSPVFEEQRRLLLAEDISLWQRYISAPRVRRFHEQVREGLMAADISSYRDITALIEQTLEEGGL